MCRRSAALDAQIEAADCLSHACATRIGTSDALRATYERIVAEEVPAELAALVERMGRERSHVS